MVREEAGRRAARAPQPDHAQAAAGRPGPAREGRARTMLRGKARLIEEQQMAPRAALRPAPRPARPCLPHSHLLQPLTRPGLPLATRPSCRLPTLNHRPITALHRGNTHATRAAAVHLAILLALFFSSVASTAPRWFSSFCRQSTPAGVDNGRGWRGDGVSSEQARAIRQAQAARAAIETAQVRRAPDRLGPDSFGWPSLNQAAPAVKPFDAWCSLYFHAPRAPDHLGSNSFSACTASSCVESPSLIAASTEQRTTRLLSPSAHLRYLRGRRGWVGEGREEGRLARRDVQTRRASGGRVRGPETGAAHAAASRPPRPALRPQPSTPCKPHTHL